MGAVKKTVFLTRAINLPRVIPPKKKKKKKQVPVPVKFPLG